MNTRTFCKSLAVAPLALLGGQSVKSSTLKWVTFQEQMPEHYDVIVACDARDPSYPYRSGTYIDFEVSIAEFDRRWPCAMRTPVPNPSRIITTMAGEYDITRFTHWFKLEPPSQ